MKVSEIQEPSVSCTLIYSYFILGSKFMISTKCFPELKIQKIKQNTGEGPYKVLGSCTTLPLLFSFGMLFFFVSKFPDSLPTELCNIILNINQTGFIPNVSSRGDHRDH